MARKLSQPKLPLNARVNLVLMNLIALNRKFARRDPALAEAVENHLKGGLRGSGRAGGTS